MRSQHNTMGCTLYDIRINNYLHEYFKTHRT